MKKITLNLLTVFFICVSAFLEAQEKATSENIKCLTDIYNANLLETHPNMMGGEAFKLNLEKQIEKSKGIINNKKILVTIPLVIHVLHNGEPIGTGANISDAQVLSQVTVMNEDFRMMAGTPGQSTAGGVDVEVNFVMAQQTPDGCATNGINRVNICQDGTNQADVQTWKANTIWNRDLYMNMWSSKYVGDLNGVLGFAQFPGGPANTDGVSAGHTFFGSSDYNDGTFNTSPPYDKGRTMTHEVGHYLGLFHTFQGGCNGAGDQVTDTPAVAAPNFGCSPNTSCGSADMIENYMDYTDDTCMNTFTAGQKTRVQNVLASSRLGLASSNGATPPASEANDAEITIECLSIADCDPELNANLKITNWGTSTLTAANISYNIDGGTPLVYNWTGSLAFGQYDEITLPTITTAGGTQILNTSIVNVNNTADARSCNNIDSKEFTTAATYPTTTQVIFTIVTDDYPGETEWEFKNEAGAVLYAGGPYNQVGATFTETFDVDANQCYTFTITDTFGDGICCAEGNGSYELKTSDNTIIFTGGSFGTIENTNISTNALSVDEFALSGISIYPNPAHDVLYIKGLNTTIERVEIYSVTGQKVISTTTNLNAINVSAIANGVYFLKLNTENTSKTVKFLKE